MKKLASASSEEVILLEQHKSLIGFLAFPAIFRQFLLSSYTLPAAGMGAYILVHQLSLVHTCKHACKYNPSMQRSMLPSPARRAILTSSTNTLIFCGANTFFTARTLYLSKKAKIAFQMYSYSTYRNSLVLSSQHIKKHIARENKYVQGNGGKNLQYCKCPFE